MVSWRKIDSATLWPLYLVLILGCNLTTSTPVQEKTDSLETKPDYNWQEGFGLTHDPRKDSIWQKPVQFYLELPGCSPLARAFYDGSFRPSDNDSTAALLALAVTEDSQLRPFYRWCLNKTIQIQDGALGEYTGVPARKYAEKFPEEFFHYMDQDTSGSRYSDWVEAISYSGFYDGDNYEKPKEVRQRFEEEMKQHCGGCSQDLVRRIENFVAACFH